MKKKPSYTRTRIRDAFYFAIDDSVNKNVLNNFLLWVCKLYGGYTLITGEGGWVDNNGKLYVEPCYILIIFTDKGTNYMQIINRIKTTFNQSAVLFERCILDNVSGIY